ncbi:MAG: hypothetical protein HGA74_11035 [Deltaproteobacteria bacterium]|nr:hypothetical protein [Deltaproteobacteria bacterium]
MRNKFLGTGYQGFNPIRKIRVAMRGAYYAVIFDFAVAYKIVLSFFILAACFYYRQWLDFGLVLVSTALMLVSDSLPDIFRKVSGTPHRGIFHWTSA